MVYRSIPNCVHRGNVQTLELIYTNLYICVYKWSFITFLITFDSLMHLSCIISARPLACIHQIATKLQWLDKNSTIFIIGVSLMFNLLHQQQIERQVHIFYVICIRATFFYWRVRCYYHRCCYCCCCCTRVWWPTCWNLWIDAHHFINFNL